MRINWEFTNKIIKNISAIERAYGRFEGMRLPQKLQLNLERNHLVRSTYISNSIEGNPLSLAEVTNLLLGDRMPANRNEKEVHNYFNILKKLELYAKKEFDVKMILDVHRQLMIGVNDKIAGKIRDKRVVVGGYKEIDGKMKLKIKHEPPSHKKKDIEKALKNLCRWVNTEQNMAEIIKIAILHHWFVHVHPFIDGNGRACRLLTALLFLKNDYKINKYFVLDDYYDVDRKLYSNSLSMADSGNHTAWIEYFTDGVKYSLLSALENAKKAVITLNIGERLTTKEKEVLKLAQELNEFITSDIVDRLGVSRQQVHRLLASLVKKGFINKSGSTKSSAYKIN